MNFKTNNERMFSANFVSNLLAIQSCIFIFYGLKPYRTSFETSFTYIVCFFIFLILLAFTFFIFIPTYIKLRAKMKYNKVQAGLAYLFLINLYYTGAMVLLKIARPENEILSLKQVIIGGIVITVFSTIANSIVYIDEEILEKQIYQKGKGEDIRRPS